MLLKKDEFGRKSRKVDELAGFELLILTGIISLVTITGTPIRGTFEVLEPCDGKLSRTVLRGEGSRKAHDLPGLLTYND